MSLLVDPTLVQSWTGTDLASAWYTALGGIMLCSVLISTKQHTKIWTFDKSSSSLILQCKTLIYCRRFTIPFNRIQSVKKTHLKNSGIEIIVNDLDSYLIEIQLISAQNIDEYVKIINDFLNLAESKYSNRQGC
jgi:membrane protein YdbS with pleckstrin-like domain